MTKSEKNKSKKFIGQYQIVKTIAKGGYSKVYLVEDSQDSNKKYALKAIRDSSEKYKLQNEINIHKKMAQHDNIIRLEKIIKVSYNWFFLFEYANEGDLEKQILKDGMFDEDKVLSVAKDMVNVLKHIQHLNIIHNDIKPSNILSKEGRYYLCDWGIAVNSNASETLHIRSDEIYVAPEVFRGTFSNKCDIYSLGCTLYYLATGKKVYDVVEKCTYSYIMYAHCCLNIDLTEIKSKKLQYLISGMMIKNPKDRISLEDIENIIENKENFSQEYKKVDYSVYKNKDCFELYEEMVDKGILFAYNNLAYLLEIDKKRKDIKKAMHLYEIAARKGLTKAMYNLALCYFESKDIKKDDTNAFYWFRQAALKNHEKAQYHLAFFYEKGKVIEQDINKAIQLYKISALAGYKKSYIKLQNLK